MTLRRNYLGSFAGQLAQVLTLTLVTLVTARALGAAGQGELAVIIALGTLLANATGLSLPHGTIYFLSSGDIEPGVLVGNALRVVLVIGVGVTAVTWLSGDMVLRVTSLGIESDLWIWVALLIPATYLAEYGGAFHAGRRDFSTIAIVNLVTGVVFFACVWGLLRGERATVAIAALLFVAYRFLRAGMLWAVLPRPWRTFFSGDAGVFRQTASYSLQSHLGVVLQMAVYRLDLLILTALAGPVAGGIYSIAAMFAESISHVGFSISRVVLPEVAARDGDAARDLAARVLRQTLWVTALGAAGVGSVVYWLLPMLVGEEYRESVLAVWLLLPGIVALAATRVCLQAIAGGGWPWAVSLAAGVGLILTIGLDFLLIPLWGVAGAAVASTISYGIQCAFTLYIYRRQVSVTWGNLLAFRQDDYRLLFEALRRVSRA